MTQQTRQSTRRLKQALTALSILLVGGCAQSRMSQGLSGLMPGGSVTSSQWEPEVDYEAELKSQAKK